MPKRRLPPRLDRVIAAQQAVLAAIPVRSGSLSARNVRRSARRGLQQCIPQMVARGNSDESTARILGLTVIDIRAVKARQGIR